MERVIVVGVDGRDQSRDAVALGAALAGALEADPVLVHVHPHDPPGGRTPLASPPPSPLAEEVRTLLREAAADAPVDVRIAPVAAASPPHGLHAVAEQLDAALIVVGSSHRAGAGRVLLGSHAEAVIAGAPCAVAVAPHGLAGRGWSLGSIAVGFDGSAEAREALVVARTLAAPTGARLRLVGVLGPAAPIIWEPYAYVPDWPVLQEMQREDLEGELAAAAEGAETEIRSGDVVEELAAAGAEADLLVLGSRAYGPVRRVLLGGHAHRVVREAAGPVLVVPRSAGTEPA